MTHPLHDDNVIKMLQQNADSLLRGTGRSTRIALRLIATAMEAPGVAHKVTDHHHSPMASHHLMCMVGDLIQRLRFEHFSFIYEDIHQHQWYLVFGKPLELKGKRHVSIESTRG